MGSVWFILFWAMVAWAVVRVTSQEVRPESLPTAMEVARQRDARGDLSKEQFEDIRRNLAA